MEQLSMWLSEASKLLLRPRARRFNGSWRPTHFVFLRFSLLAVRLGIDWIEKDLSRGCGFLCECFGVVRFCSKSAPTADSPQPPGRSRCSTRAEQLGSFEREFQRVAARSDDWHVVGLRVHDDSAWPRSRRLDGAAPILALGLLSQHPDRVGRRPSSRIGSSENSATHWDERNSNQLENDPRLFSN